MSVGSRLRGLWRAPIEEQLEVIRSVERVAEELLAAERWSELTPLAGQISEAYCRAGSGTELTERRTHWCAIEVDAARRVEGELGGPLMLAALQRLGRSQISIHGDSSAAHDTFMRAVAVAERVHGPDSPELIELLLLAKTGADSATKISLAERAARIAEAAFGPSSPRLARPLRDLALGLQVAGRTDEAIVACERAMALADDDARNGGMLAMQLADLYALARRFDDALRMRIESINDADSDVERRVACAFLAETLHSAERHEAALIAVEQASVVFGEDAWFAAMRARALSALGRTELASDAARHAIELARKQRGDAYAKKIADYIDKRS